MATTENQGVGYWQILRLVYRAWRFRLGRDKHEIATLLTHLQPGNCAIDIGAHKGAYTYWMQKTVGPEGSVYAFEPQPQLAGVLKALLAKMAIKHVTVEQIGLSDQAAIGELYVPGDGSASPGASLVGKSITGDKTTIKGIKLETLDGYFTAKPTVHLIKCDVEGHELAVFKSGRELLMRDRPLIMFECEERHQSEHGMADVFQFLLDLDYTGHFYYQGVRHPVTDFRQDMQQDAKNRDYVNNFIFIPQPKPALK